MVPGVGLGAAVQPWAPMPGQRGGSGKAAAGFCSPVPSAGLLGEGRVGSARVQSLACPVLVRRTPSWGSALPGACAEDAELGLSAPRGLCGEGRVSARVRGGVCGVL